MSKDLKDEIDLWITHGGHTIWHRRQPNPTVLICFIPGNPGLVEYYRDFLTHLWDADELNTEISRFRIYGRSLGGFEVGVASHNGQKQTPYTLKEQIDHVQRELYTLIDSWRRDDPEEGKQAERIPVILVGHSVGAYIALELLAEQQRHQKASGSTRIDGKYNYEIIGGIGLFPTVIHLAESPRGRKVAAFGNAPGLSWLLQLLVKILLLFVPTFLLTRLLASLMPHASPSAKQTTLAFLNSKHGVRQALYMGQYELLEMTKDKWDDDLWNTPKPQRSTFSNIVPCDKPPLHFYFGENDYWIDNTIRDNLIAARGRRQGVDGEEQKPWMEIDRNGVPHDFCVDQKYSRLIAAKVAKFIEDIVEKKGL